MTTSSIKHSVLIQRVKGNRLYVFEDGNRMPVEVSVDDTQNPYAGLATYLASEGHQVVVEATYIQDAWKVDDGNRMILYKVTRSYGFVGINDPNTAEIFYIQVFIDVDGNIGAYYKAYNPELNTEHITVKFAPGNYLYMTELPLSELSEKLRRFLDGAFEYIEQQRLKAISQT